MPTSPGCAGGGRTSCSPLRASGCPRLCCCRCGEHGAPRAVRGGGQLAPLRSSSLVTQFSVDKGRKDTIGRAAENDRGAWVFGGRIGRPCRRDDSEIGALARNERADLRGEAGGTGAPGRSELERLGCRQRTRTLRAGARREQNTAQLVEEVERGSGCRAVRPDPHLGAGRAQLGQRRDAAPERCVRARAVRHARAGRREQLDLLRIDHDAVRRDDVFTEQILLREHARAGRTGMGDEQVAVRAPRPLAPREVEKLGRALRDVGGHREAELRARAVEIQRDRVRSVRRDPGPDAIREEAVDALLDLGEVLEAEGRVRTEDLEIDGCAQTEISARDRGGSAVAAVADRAHARSEALRGAEARDVDVLPPADPRLALDVQGDPLGEVGETVPEAAVDGVLEVRVRVDEPRHDHSLRVVRARIQVITRADRDDAAALDGNRSVAERRTFDRKHPVGGENPAHGSLRLAASIRASRRSNTTDNQIESSYRMTSGTISIMVVKGSIPGSATAMQATTKYPSRRSRRSRAVDRIPSRVSATTTIGSWKTSTIASITIVANE